MQNNTLLTQIIIVVSQLSDFKYYSVTVIPIKSDNQTTYYCKEHSCKPLKLEELTELSYVILFLNNKSICTIINTSITPVKSL